jgi:hypothetical protein
MALQLGTQSQFSILALIEKLGADIYAEGSNPLHKFDLDLERGIVPGIWRPSGIRYCMRKQVYKACKTPKSPYKFDPARQFMFDRGHVFGAWIAAYVLALDGRYGITSVQSEVVLHDPETGLGGKADVVLERGGSKYVVEFKSKDNAAAMRNIKAEEKALHQLNDYMHMAGAEYGWLVYFGVDFVNYVPRATKPPRTTIAAKEFRHKYSPSMWDETAKKTLTLEWFLKDRSKLAPKTANPYFECGSCDWKWACDKELTPEDARGGIVDGPS